MCYSVLVQHDGIARYWYAILLWLTLVVTNQSSVVEEPYGSEDHGDHDGEEQGEQPEVKDATATATHPRHTHDEKQGGDEKLGDGKRGHGEEAAEHVMKTTKEPKETKKEPKSKAALQALDEVEADGKKVREGAAASQEIPAEPPAQTPAEASAAAPETPLEKKKAELEKNKASLAAPAKDAAAGSNKLSLSASMVAKVMGASTTTTTMTGSSPEEDAMVSEIVTAVKTAWRQQQKNLSPRPKDAPVPSKAGTMSSSTLA